MAIHHIPEEAGRRFTTSDGRKAIMRNYLGIFSGVNEDGEQIQLNVCPNAIELTTFQSNGWIRINYYDADGLPAGETFDGKWL